MIKKFILAILFTLVLSGGASADKEIAKVIENCADRLVQKEEIEILEKYKAAYDLEAQFIYLNNTLQIHERWINFLENEIEVLNNDWDKNYAFYLEHKNEYEDLGISNNLPYLSRFSDKYLKEITGNLLKEDSYRKKVGSTYFLDKEITRKQLNKALSDNNRWLEEKKSRIDYLLTPKGENEFNNKLKKRMLSISNEFQLIREQNLTEKINKNEYEFGKSKFSYVDFFKICESARMESPILFDTKFKK
jgi:hypothetical protein